MEEQPTQLVQLKEQKHKAAKTGVVFRNHC